MHRTRGHGRAARTTTARRTVTNFVKENGGTRRTPAVAPIDGVPFRGR